MNRWLRVGVLAATPLLVGFSPLSWIDPAAGENQAGNQKYRNGQFEGAAGHYSKGNAASPGRPELLYNLGNSLERLGKHEEAAAAYQQALENAGPTLAPQAWYNLGNSLLAAGQAKQAVQAYRESLVRDPANEQAKRNLELALEQAKKEPPQKKPGPNDKQQDEKKNDQQKNDQQHDQGSNQDRKQSPNPDQNQQQDRQSSSGSKPKPDEDQQRRDPDDERPEPRDEQAPKPEQQPEPPPPETASKDEQDLSREQAEGLLRSFEQMERRQLQDAHPPKGPGEALGRRDW